MTTSGTPDDDTAAPAAPTAGADPGTGDAPSLPPFPGGGQGPAAPPPPGQGPSGPGLPPPGPPAGPAAPRRLLRTPDGKIAGVCAGVGHYLGIDPVLVRLGFVALTLLGGSGLLIYAVAWVVIPKAAPGEPIPAPGSWGEASPITIAGLVGIVIGLAFVFGAGPFDGARSFLPLLLIAGGVALLLQRPEPAPQPPSSLQSSTPPIPGGAGPVAPTADPATGPFPGPGPAGAEPLPGGGEGWSPPPPGWGWGSAAWTPPPPPPVPPVPPVPPTPPAPSVPPRRARRPFGTLTIGILALAGGVALAAHLAGWVALTPTVALAAALVVVGVVAVVAAFSGGSPSVLALGLVLTGGLLAATVAEPVLGDGVGERRARPASVADLEPRYAVGVGDLTVDLRGVNLAAGRREVEVRAGIGQVTVLVPPDVDVELRSWVGLGEIVGPTGRTVSGVGRRLDTFDDSPGSGRLVIDVGVGIGQGTVRRG